MPGPTEIRFAAGRGDPPGYLLLLGGSGFVGRTLAEVLCRPGHDEGPWILAPTRHMGHGLASLGALPRVDVVEADVHDDAALAHLVAGASGAAPSALTWITRRTPALRHAAPSRRGSETLTRSNSLSSPCRMAIRLITVD
ncbi:MAG TPA: hypothetical protein VGQ91_17295, partial [Ideonella sp.]|nr:hypothetical protein [Ideonella sp.]